VAHDREEIAGLFGSPSFRQLAVESLLAAYFYPVPLATLLLHKRVPAIVA
jgi:hypothetical protein